MFRWRLDAASAVSPSTSKQTTEGKDKLGIEMVKTALTLRSELCSFKMLPANQMRMIPSFMPLAPARYIHDEDVGEASACAQAILLAQRCIVDAGFPGLHQLLRVRVE
jgi:hypothetical protein